MWMKKCLMEMAKKANWAERLVDILECRLEGHKKIYENIEKDVYESVYGQHMSEELATEACEAMLNVDGTTGAKWKKAETDAVAKNVGYDGCLWDFYYVMNMFHSDYSDVMTGDATTFGKAAKHFIEDKDVPEGKPYRYYMYVAKCK